MVMHMEKLRKQGSCSLIPHRASYLHFDTQAERHDAEDMPHQNALMLIHDTLSADDAISRMLGCFLGYRSPQVPATLLVLPPSS